MNNPEFEPEMDDIDPDLKKKGVKIGVDKSGYSEKRTDLQIDKKGTGGQQVKQFNRLTNNQSSVAKGGTFVPSKNVKKVKEDTVVFELK
jgi:hypothetical protein